MLHLALALFLAFDIDVIKASLRRNIRTIRYVPYYTKDIVDVAIEEAKRLMLGFTSSYTEEVKEKPRIYKLIRH